MISMESGPPVVRTTAVRKVVDMLPPVDRDLCCNSTMEGLLSNGKYALQSA
jgi:hypothetical protein